MQSCFACFILTIWSYLRGSCNQVIDLTKAFRKEQTFHHLKPHGIIDRDRRTESEIEALKKDGIFVLDVAEIENLFCVPEILEIISEHQGFKPENNKVVEAKNFIIQSFKDELDTQISLRASAEVKFQLMRLEDITRGEEALAKALEGITKNINVAQIYSESQKLFQEALRTNDYKAILTIYNRKSLASRLGGIFGLREKDDQLVQLVLRLAKTKGENRIYNALKDYIPKLD